MQQKTWSIFLCFFFCRLIQDPIRPLEPGKKRWQEAGEAPPMGSHELRPHHAPQRTQHRVHAQRTILTPIRHVRRTALVRGTL
jgi:hypothetical protein